MASCIREFGSPGFCSEMSFPFLLKDCTKKRLCMVCMEDVLRGLRRLKVVLLGPYSCLFWRIVRHMMMGYNF